MTSTALDTHSLLRSLQATRTLAAQGRVVQAGGTVIRATGVQARIGQTCRVFDPTLDAAAPALMAEVVGFHGAEVILAPLGPLQGLPAGAAVAVCAEEARLPCGQQMLGRVIDAFARPLDGAGPLRILFSVVLPQSWPVITTTALLHFFYIWNETRQAALYLSTNRPLAPVSFSVQNFQSLFPNQNLLQASALIVMLVPVIIILISQGYFMQKLVVTGIEK